MHSRKPFEISALSSGRNQINDPAWYVGVFVQVIAGADPVVAVGDDEWDLSIRHATNQEHRGQQATLSDLLQVLRHMEVVRGEEGKAAGAQKVLRFVILDWGLAQAPRQLPSRTWSGGEAQIVLGGGVVVVIGALLPLLFTLRASSHGKERTTFLGHP